MIREECEAPTLFCPSSGYTIFKSRSTTPISIIWRLTTSGLDFVRFTPRKSLRLVANHSGNTSATILAQVRKRLGP